MDNHTAQNSGPSAGLPGYLPIAEHGVIGDLHTAALIGTDGTIDWYCCPSFDSPSVFGAILDRAKGGYYRIAPATDGWTPKQLYLPDTNVLITRFLTEEGVGEVQDFMPVDSGRTATHRHRLVRRVLGVRGTMHFVMNAQPRFNYGRDEHDMFFHENGVLFRSPGISLALETPLELKPDGAGVQCHFALGPGESATFVLERVPADYVPRAYSAEVTREAFEATVTYWRNWLARSSYQGRWREMVHRSALTLKLLTHLPTGAIVAAPTTSLPEQLGGNRNWDYRFCWLRDATLTLMALMNSGYTEEAASWRDWLQRSIAGSADQIQIMYGLEGERRMDEWEVPWLIGYQGAAPVRIGNAAAGQVQLDVYGEVLECLHQARRHGLRPPPHGWGLQRAIVEHLEAIWDQPDEGIWEVRGGARDFTFSKIMAWVALDRMVRDATKYHLSGDIAGWRNVRDKIHAEVLARGFDEKRNTFTQSFGSTGLDASLLLIPMVGFLPANDPRVRGTVAAVERELMIGGFVQRYSTETQVDGLPPGEGAFLACSFWLADAYALQGRTQDAEALFERLLDLRNDVGLLSEEYDPRFKRLVGNFPQAFSHVALVGTAMTLIGRGARNGG